MQGWIKVYRKLTENPIWLDKPFSKGQAWIDLLFMANSKPTKLVYGNTIIELKRGQLHTSEIKLMARWGWSKKKVRAYLALLETLKMATADGTTKGTVVTIENYGVYQSLREPKNDLFEMCGRCADDNQKKDTAKDTAKDTTVTIENYSVYQDCGTAQDTKEYTAKEPRRNREGYTNKK